MDREANLETTVDGQVRNNNKNVYKHCWGKIRKRKLKKHKW